MPQVDPCCFPILHPRGTQGFQFYIKKKGKETKRKDPIIEEQLIMQRNLDSAFDADNIPFDDGSPPVNDILEDLLDAYENENGELNVDKPTEPTPDGFITFTKGIGNKGRPSRGLASPQAGGPSNEGEDDVEDDEDENIHLNRVFFKYFYFFIRSNLG